MGKKTAKFHDRLKEALALRGLKAIDLSEKTGIPKSMISQYLSGKTDGPRAERFSLICSTLNVSEAWMLGYDVPMDRIEEQSKDDDVYHLNLIVQNGKVEIPSVFLFENSTALLKFLEVALRRNCIVVFDNENLVVNPTLDDSRFKLSAYEQMIDNKDIGNAYLRYLGNVDKMKWENV